jgi:hypothetical protein
MPLFLDANRTIAIHATTLIKVDADVIHTTLSFIDIDVFM